MKNTLVIKTGASGDVVRTTPLLHVLEGNIYWIADAYNFPLFPDTVDRLFLIDRENIPAYFYELSFDHIINLEEDISLARMAAGLKCNKMTGVYLLDNQLSYTPDSGCWYDMSLVSKLERVAADELKKMNTLSYQEILFSMLGERFEGQPYIVFDPEARKARRRIGIETGTGKNWPNKAWNGYRKLGDMLSADHFDVFYFTRRNAIRDYLSEIKECSLLVCGDSLAMHIALAYRIPAITLFNCTSPAEIYGYNLLDKLISPKLYDYFYHQSYSPSAASAIPVEWVYQAVKRKSVLAGE